MKPKTIMILVVSIVFFIILLQNTQVVSLRLLFWEISMSRIILMPLIMLIGFGAGFFVCRKTTGK
ncbi:MAG: LapA family protein [Candidatus Omnitrophica bacterium]|nr:LapA family protein [Candidatus Omnitrophota bacterium]